MALLGVDQKRVAFGFPIQRIQNQTQREDLTHRFKQWNELVFENVVRNVPDIDLKKTI